MHNTRNSKVYQANCNDATNANNEAPAIAYKQIDKIRTFETASKMYDCVIRKIAKDASRYGGPTSYDWHTLYWTFPHYWVVMDWCVRVMSFCDVVRFKQSYSNARPRFTVSS